jgi:hypothetical protein
MSDVFGVDGPGKKKPDPKKAPKKWERPTGREPDVLYGSMDPKAGETQQLRYTQYDNDSGAIMVNLPDKFAKYKADLEEDLMDEFLGAPTGSADGAKNLDAWVKDWIERKEREDPDINRAPIDDRDGPVPPGA